MAKISTTGELRQYLANMMMGVKDGTIEPNEGKIMMGLADSINESFYAEIKVGKVRHELSQEKLSGLGEMKLDGGTV